MWSVYTEWWINELGLEPGGLEPGACLPLSNLRDWFQEILIDKILWRALGMIQKRQWLIIPVSDVQDFVQENISISWEYHGRWITKIHQVEWILRSSSVPGKQWQFHYIISQCFTKCWVCRLPKTLKAGGIQLEYGERNHHHVLPIKKDFPSRLGTSSLAFESRARVMKVKDISAKWKTCCHFGDNQLDTCFEFISLTKGGYEL